MTPEIVPRVTADDLKALEASKAAEPVLVVLNGEVTVVPRVGLTDGTYPTAEPVLTKRNLYDWLDHGQGFDDAMAQFGADYINRDWAGTLSDARRELGWGDDG
jgi:hypothetical protein